LFAIAGRSVVGSIVGTRVVGDTGILEGLAEEGPNVGSGSDFR
jgi:hypothetical protein